jgi:hypothetical protein
MKMHVRVLALAAALASHASPVLGQLRLTQPKVVLAGESSDVDVDEWSLIAVGERHALFIIDARKDAIWYMAPADRSPRRIGRRGNGPGEYQRITALGLLGDTLWVSDDGTRRISLMSRSGTQYTRSFAFSGATSDRTTMAMPLALTPDGKAISAMLAAAPSSALGLSTSDPIARVARAGASTWDTLMLIERRHQVYEVAIGSGRMTGTQPMSDGTLWAVSRNGQYAVKVDREDDAPPVRGTLVTLFSTAGKRVYQKALPRAGTVVRDADFEAVVRREAAVFRRATKPRGMPEISESALRRVLYRPRYVVPFTGVIAADDGSVILRGNDWNTDTVTHTWLTSSGAVRGRFTTPPNQHVRAVRDDVVWSVVVDDDGVGSIIQQRVIK